MLKRINLFRQMANAREKWHYKRLLLLLSMWVVFIILVGVASILEPGLLGGFLFGFIIGSIFLSMGLTTITVEMGFKGLWVECGKEIEKIKKKEGEIG